MYEIIKNVIEKQEFDLREMLYKIAKMYIEGYITEKQKEELETLARKNAKSENSYAPLQEQIDNLYKDINILKETVEANARGMASIKEAVEKLGGTTEEPEYPPVEKYPEYKQPSGAHDAYKIGNKITYKDKKYECILDNCVWSPEEFPQGWKEIIEENVVLESEEGE